MKLLLGIYLLLLLFGPQSLNLSNGDTNRPCLQGCCEGVVRAEPETSSPWTDLGLQDLLQSEKTQTEAGAGISRDGKGESEVRGQPET